MALLDELRSHVAAAGVIVELVANDLDPDRLGDEELAVPQLIDGEVTNVLRRLVVRKALTDKQATAAMNDGKPTDTRLANAPGITCPIELL